jgi:hypothetical protein
MNVIRQAVPVQEVVQAYEDHKKEYADGALMDAATHRAIDPHIWWEVELTAAELGAIETILPGESNLVATGQFVPKRTGPASALLEGWLVYLKQNASDAAGHAALLQKLGSGNSLETLILGQGQVRDGRHRMFAILDFEHNTKIGRVYRVFWAA